MKLVRIVVGFVVGLIGTYASVLVVLCTCCNGRDGLSWELCFGPFLAVAGGVIGAICNSCINWSQYAAVRLFKITAAGAVVCAVVLQVPEPSVFDSTWFEVSPILDRAFCGLAVGAAIGSALALFAFALWPRLSERPLDTRVARVPRPLCRPDEVWPPAPDPNAACKPDHRGEYGS
ncbi:MAG: hypothetical protein ACLQVD_11325 [Capsulimonadaceae bacterium]